MKKITKIVSLSLVLVSGVLFQASANANAHVWSRHYQPYSRTAHAFNQGGVQNERQQSNRRGRAIPVGRRVFVDPRSRSRHTRGRRGPFIIVVVERGGHNGHNGYRVSWASWGVVSPHRGGRHYHDFNRRYCNIIRVAIRSQRHSHSNRGGRGPCRAKAFSLTSNHVWDIARAL